MKWAKFKNLSYSEKGHSLSIKSVTERLLKPLAKSLKEGEVEAPFDDDFFIACNSAWLVYTLFEIGEKFFEEKFTIKNREYLAPVVLLEFAKRCPKYFFGFRNSHGDFVPGLIPILTQDPYNNEIEKFLIKTDLSKMTIRNAAFKFRSEVDKKDSIEKLYKRIQKRVSEWDS
jgi:hypothetical protein